MHIFLLILLQSFFNAYPKDCRDALDFIEENNKTINLNLHNLSDEEKIMAMAIVAPEISQFSSVMDFVELRALFISYRNFGKGDFSVGYFQMKPSFVETLETEIMKNNKLKSRYSSFIPNGGDKSKREQRLKRLSSLEWQLKYLEVFFEIAKLKTASIKFKDQEDKLKYFATLYNSGINSSSKRVEEMQKKTYFPHNVRKYNYSDVALEFYREMLKK